MTTQHSTIRSFNLAPQQSAKAYKEIYQEIRDFAGSQDNRAGDDAFRGGEVWIRAKDEDEFVSLGFQHDEGYVREHLSVYQSELKADGKRAGTVGGM